jgi:hypothetical protein
MIYIYPKLDIFNPDLLKRLIEIISEVRQSLIYSDSDIPNTGQCVVKSTLGSGIF